MFSSGHIATPFPIENFYKIDFNKIFKKKNLCVFRIYYYEKIIHWYLKSYGYALEYF